MGMFDTVYCELPLPGEPKPSEKAWLQTKDFNRYLDTYIIKTDGTLEGPDGPKRFDGILHFHTYETDGGIQGPASQPGMWFEYEANFTDGNLTSLECVVIERCHWGEPKHEVIWSRSGLGR